MAYEYHSCPRLLQTDARQKCPLNWVVRLITRSYKVPDMLLDDTLLSRYYAPSFPNAASGLWNTGGRESNKGKFIRKA